MHLDIVGALQGILYLV